MIKVRTQGATVALTALTAVAFVAISEPTFVDGLRLRIVLVVLVVLASTVRATATSSRARPTSLIYVLPFAVPAWATLSVMWSDLPSRTFFATIDALLVIVLVLILVRRSAPDSLAKGLVVGGCFVAVACLALAFLVPATGRGFGAQAGSVQGFYLQKNLFGYTVCTAYAVALATRLRFWRHIWLKTAIVVLLLGSVVISRSSTALVSAAATTLVLCLYWFMSASSARSVRALLAGAMVLTTAATSSLILSNQELLLGALGRDDTLSGRTVIWSAVWPSIQQQRFIGHGYGATWGPGAPVGSIVSARAGFYVPHAHSGYLDAWVQVGFVGVVIFAMLILLPIAVGIYRGISGTPASLPLALAALQLVYNADETRLDLPFGLFTIAIAFFLTFANSQSRQAEVPFGPADISTQNRLFQ